MLGYGVPGCFRWIASCRTAVSLHQVATRANQGAADCCPGAGPESPPPQLSFWRTTFLTAGYLSSCRSLFSVFLWFVLLLFIFFCLFVVCFFFCRALLSAFCFFFCRSLLSFCGLFLLLPFTSFHLLFPLLPFLSFCLLFLLCLRSFLVLQWVLYCPIFVQRNC